MNYVLLLHALMSLENGIFPNQTKVAKIVVIHEKGILTNWQTS